jgi:hypothetical protein
MLLPPVHSPPYQPFDLQHLIDAPFLFELVGIGILWVGARIAMRR